MHRKVEWSDLTHRENSFPTHGMNECIYWSLTESPHDTVFACCDIQYSSIRLEKLVLNTRRNFELQSSETIIQPARVQASKFAYSMCIFGTVRSRLVWDHSILSNAKYLREAYVISCMWITSTHSAGVFSDVKGEAKTYPSRRHLPVCEVVVFQNSLIINERKQWKVMIPCFRTYSSTKLDRADSCWIDIL